MLVHDGLDQLAQRLRDVPIDVGAPSPSLVVLFCPDFVPTRPDSRPDPTPSSLAPRGPRKVVAPKQKKADESPTFPAASNRCDKPDASGGDFV